MSMPKFPDIDSDLTCEYALNMILVSIAMEELALSHIINAEGEKLQYVLGTLETGCGRTPNIDDVLAVNKSINCLMDSISQNQMILKSKMDNALSALENVCPRHPEPPRPPKPPCPPRPPCPPGLHGPREPEGPMGPACQCHAVFKSAGECRKWYPGSSLCWTKVLPHGKCVHIDHRDKSKILLCNGGPFFVSFTINVKTRSDCNCDAAIRLQALNNHNLTDICTVHGYIPRCKTITISTGEIIEASACRCKPTSLFLKLVSSDALVVESAKLSIVDIG